jgi:hypothetical protein
MFGRSRTERLKRNAVSASDLALQLAQDKKFRTRLISAIEHSTDASERAHRSLGPTGTIRRLAADQALQAELRQAREDLQQAYSRLEAKRRTHRLRNAITLLAGVAALAAFPKLRQRISAKLSRLAARSRPEAAGDRASRPRNFEDLSKEELYTRAQEAEIPGRSDMSKEELIEALRAKG